MSATIRVSTIQDRNIKRTFLGKKSVTVRAISLMAFYLLFSFSFTIVVGGVVFADNIADYSPAIPLLLITSELAFLVLVQRALDKHADFVEKKYPFIIASGLLPLFVMNMIMGYLLRYDPIFDLGAIFTGAKEWATTGSFMERMNPTCDPNYFYYFPNNLGAMTLLFLAFQAASLFGAADFFAIAMVTNALLATATVLLIVLICKRMFGITQSVTALFFVLLSPPFYLIAPVFYTDSLSMVFPVLIVYLYLKYLDSTTGAKKALFISLLGFFCAVGVLVKFTVIITLIAIILYDMLARGIFSSLRITMATGIIIATVFFLFNAYFYSTHLEKTKAEKLNIPFTHWIMMSLDNGFYNPEDYEFTLSFTDKEEQATAINGRIKERIAEKGVSGMLRLFFWKGTVAFGDGTFAQSDFLDDNPANETGLHSFVLYDGEYYPVYKYVCSGSYFTLQLLMLLSAYRVLLQRKKSYRNLLPLLCVFGIMVFLMIWEVSGRYVTNYVPMMILSAVSGLHVLMEASHSGDKRLYTLTDWRASINSNPF